MTFDRRPLLRVFAVDVFAYLVRQRCIFRRDSQLGVCAHLVIVSMSSDSNESDNKNYSNNRNQQRRRPKEPTRMCNKDDL